MADTLLDEASSAVETALAAGAQDAAATVRAESSGEFVYRDGKLEEAKQSISRRLAVQLYVDGRYSDHNTSDLRGPQVKAFIQQAVELTRLLEVDPYRRIPSPDLYENRCTADLELVDPVVAKLGREPCLEWLRVMDSAAHAHKQVISATNQVFFGRSTSARATSNGFAACREDASVGYGGMVTLSDSDGRRPEAWKFVNGRHLRELPKPASVAAEALQRGVDRLGSRKDASARTYLVVHPEAGGMLLWHLLHALFASAVQQKRSFLEGKLGQAIAGDTLTLTDQPLLARGLASRTYDDEGISARTMTLVERGVLRHYYVDTYYGRKLGWQPTTGSFSNVIVGPGPKGPEQLIAAVGRGFYVMEWMGGNADTTTGDFSFGLRGHRIENGVKGGPISEMNVTGNYLELLKHLVAVGNDPYPWSSFRTPTLVFEGVQFAGL